MNLPAHTVIDVVRNLDQMGWLKTIGGRAKLIDGRGEQSQTGFVLSSFIRDYEFDLMASPDNVLHFVSRELVGVLEGRVEVTPLDSARCHVTWTLTEQPDHAFERFLVKASGPFGKKASRGDAGKELVRLETLVRYLKFDGPRPIFADPV